MLRHHTRVHHVVGVTVCKEISDSPDANDQNDASNDSSGPGSVGHDDFEDYEPGLSLPVVYFDVAPEHNYGYGI